MTLATLLSRTPQGLEAPLVRVEVDVGGGGRLEAFDAVFANVAGTTVVGYRCTAEHDESAPAANCRDCRSFSDGAVTIEIRLRFGFQLIDGGHDDGFTRSSGGVDFRATHNDDGAEGIVVLGGRALVVESRIDFGPRFDGQSGTIGDKDFVREDIHVVPDPGGIGSDRADVGAKGSGVHGLSRDDVDVGCVRHARKHRGERHEAEFIQRGWFHRFDMME